MTVSVELIIAFLGMMGSVATLAIHQLMHIGKTLTTLVQNQAVNKVWVESQIEALKVHDQRNEVESRNLRHYLGMQHGEKI